ncbi:LOW QUALITY PROTEIN: probable lipoxygenase 8, chloroplastic [Elaeis guineensis]|uniref:Lipoxygenase n=1 Tax=Elaeis guineensis var. tenera TaxID=51953 RepID=A0A6I9SHT8_ELAGV|nr:probable lipoxygenase 8, chloroplastic isoform X1 [Elaeis guineensis]
MFLAASQTSNLHSLPLLFFSGRSRSHRTLSKSIFRPSVPRRTSARCGQTCCALTAVPPTTSVGSEAAVPSATSAGSMAAKAVVTVKLTVGGFFENFRLTRAVDDINDMIGKTLVLGLVSTELDPSTGLEKDAIEAYARRVNQKGDEVKYEVNFSIPEDFGDIGGILVMNKQHKEMFIRDITLVVGHATVTVHCNSWVHALSDSPEKRIFFTETCLPNQTPSGVQRLRKKELKTLRGNAQGKRKRFERIYDYDTYNDLGCPDQGDEKARPVLGGKQHPYPRRCRTGRPPTKKDPLSETRSDVVYVPRDEALSEVKQMTITAKTLNSALDAVFPFVGTVFINTMLMVLNLMGKDTASNKPTSSQFSEELDFSQTTLTKLMKSIADGCGRVRHDSRTKDKLTWCRDEEFARRTLAGLNPFGIQLLKELPLVSKLDPELYGPPESAITKELVEREIKMSIEEALEEKRLFILDYHDLLLPYVHKVRELEGTTLYGSRTLFFLMEDATLRPVAIELTRPASPTKPQWKRVFTRSWDSTGAWLWTLAKAHVCAHDSGYHQLIAHWLRGHCCTEPYIIAANRQLSVMHPIHQLLRPHFRYTLEINAIARKNLICAGGLIESCFSPGKYSMELSSFAYDQLWRFDMDALPADLIRRGMAVEDPAAEHGLRLTIEDYPFASDGLLIWSAIKQWVQDYVSHYYPDPAHVLDDYELQGWWTEVRTKGHEDKKDEPWWPILNSPENLAQVLTTIIWVASAHHAAVNFGLSQYVGNIPHRPTIARTTMPVEDEPEGEAARFWDDPEAALLECLPSPVQATQVMAWLDVLSSHASDEEYLGGDLELGWAKDPMVRTAYEKFHRRLKEVEGIIDERNRDTRLKNRCGAGIAPYEILKPFSRPGVTGMGIPNSISI